MKKNTAIIILLIITFFSVGGCVGTIKSANSVSTKASNVVNPQITSYAGIESVEAIADSKVDVFFPQFSGNADKIAYVIRYSGQQIPVYIQGDSLKPVIHINADNQRVSSLKATISDLRTDSEYEFSVEVRDITTGSESSNNIYKTVKTFPNQTARFGGVTEVSNLPGVNGLTGIEVFWIEAEVRGTTNSKNDIDPVYYVITVLDGSTPGLAKSPADMNDETLSSASRQTYTVNAGKRSQVINGLRTFTKYYVQVRAVHYGKTLNMAAPGYRVEENTNYLEIVTLDPGTPPTVTDPSSFASAYPSGPNGLTSINLTWKKTNGVFDHYRLYYQIGDFTPTVTPNCITNCVRISFEDNLYQLVGVTARKNYYLWLYSCRDSACTSYVTYNKISHVTSPPVITNYGGIFSIDTAKNLATLDKLFLNIGIPDFNLGYIAGVDLFGCHSSSTSACDPVNISSLLSPTTNLSTDPSFDYSVDGVLAISGIDPASIYPYCFYARPYVYDDLGVKSYVSAPLSSVRCKVPEIKAPAFSGFDLDSTCNLLKWQTPSSGIFDGYEIYYRLKSSVYEVSIPLALDGSYQRIIVNANLNEFSTLQLPLVTGGAYDFGIRTIYRSADGEAYWLRSSNTGIDKLIKCPMTN